MSLKEQTKTYQAGLKTHLEAQVAQVFEQIQQTTSQNEKTTRENNLSMERNFQQTLTDLQKKIVSQQSDWQEKMRTNLVQFVETRVEQAMAQASTRSVAQVIQTSPPIDQDLVTQLEGRILGQVQQMLSEAEKRQLAGVRQMVQQVTPFMMPSYPIAPDRSEQIQQLQ